MAKERKGKELPKGKPRGRGKHSSSTRSQRNIAHSRARSLSIQPKDVNLTKILQTLKPHDHLCLIYESPEEWRAAAVPFIAVGLKRGEKCLYIADTSTADEIRKYLAEEGIDVASAEKSGQLSILNQAEAYTIEGSFDPDSMIALLVEETEKAIAEGYPALRVTGEMTWVLRDYPGSEKLLEYEAKLNRDFFPYHPCLAICQYDRWKFDPEVIKGVVMTHPLLVRGNHIYHNFYYIPPEEFLDQRHAELEVQHWLNNLEREQQVRETLRQSEEHFRALIENSSDVVTIIDSLGTVRYRSPNYEAVLGRAATSEIGRDIFKNVHPDDVALVGEKFDYLLKNPRGIVNINVRAQHRDGSWRTIEVLGHNLLDNPVVCGIVVNFRDITEHKRADESLRLSEQNFRDSIEKSPLGIRIVTEDGKTLYVNKTFLDICGYGSLEELNAVPRKQRYTPESYVESKERVSKRKRGEYVPSHYEISIVRKDGQVRRLSVSRGEVLWDGEKQSQVVYQDITERKQAEEALQWSQAQYQDLYDNAPAAYYSLDTDGYIKRANKAGLKFLGYSREELQRMKFLEIYADESKAKAEELFRRFRQGIGWENEEMVYQRKNGEKVHGLLSVSPIRDENGRVLESRSVVVDVTERKKAEEALRQSEERYRAILEEMQDSYFEVDLAGHLTFVNSATCRHLGYLREELMGMSYKGLTAEDYVKSVFQIFNEVYQTGVPNKGFHWKIIRKDGSHGFIDASVTLLRNDKGEIIGFSGVGRDITERMKIEEQLMFTDRLASIGQLAAGIAHELNNPLTSVIGFSDLLLERDLPADVKGDLETVSQEARRAVNIIKGLLTFAREQRIEKELVDINSIIQGVLQLRFYEQRVSNIEVDARFAPALPQVMGNGAQLQQVCINIIINAEQAMLEAHGRGKLTIVTEQVGDMIRASITDDGPGISPDNMKKLFTPFFTTREVGKGTGLGLSICHGIVTEHGGKIYAESELGKGATFVVELPISK
jgi:PAS domain S-box-containing protein